MRKKNKCRGIYAINIMQYKNLISSLIRHIIEKSKVHLEKRGTVIKISS